jgi:hypothetical protein
MSYLHRFVSLITTISIVMGFASPVMAAKGTQQAPKLMNFWFDWQIPEQTVTDLSKWDIIVLDFDQQQYDANRMRRFKQLNPGIKILAYIDSSNIMANRFVEDSKFPGYKLAHAIPEEWFMHRGTVRASIWPASWMLNVTSKGPTDSKGRRWQDFLPEFIQNEIWSTGLWDGVFLDNAIDNATWFAGKGLDITGDGKADADATVDAEWKAGWDTLAKNVRNRLGPDALIMGNGSAKYAPLTNGILFENFPRYGWSNGFRDSQTSISQNRKPSITAFNSNTNNVNNPSDYKTMRFTLASALLGDGYFSFDQGDKFHAQTWWYDEYDATLGAAKTAPKRLQPTAGTDYKDGVWRRDYERGITIVNSGSSAATVDLTGVYERLRGSQDPTVNNGKLETAITLGAQEGLILYRRSDLAGQSTTPAPSGGSSSSPAPVTVPKVTAPVSITTAFRTGDFVRVYKSDGTQSRAGFFVQKAGVASGVWTLAQDIDRDGRADTVSSANGAIVISYGNGTSKTIRPFGTTYRGVLTIAAGNVDRDAPFELFTANDRGEARMLEQDGTVRGTFRPYGPFRGSISVAIGDINGDGLRELITGAGPGGGPHVRIFKTDGVAWPGTPWFAFDSRERGGVFVTTGDLDSDGKDEIIAGSGQGTVPRVRIFTGDQSRQREFALSSQTGSLGVHVSVTDEDGDGKLEILASGINPAP